MPEPNILSGHCLCGGCRFTLIGPHNWVGHCHCESCRRATASPMTTWIGQENGMWQLNGLTPKTFQSSAGVTRGSCPACGTPMFYRSTDYPNETHFYASLLDDPDKVTPGEHYHADEALAWLHLSDGLPHK